MEKEGRQTRQARAEHMAANWDRYKLETHPWGRDPGDPARKAKEYEIAKELKHAGLLGQKDRMDDFDDHVRLARGMKDG